MSVEPKVDIKHENRLAKVLTLHSKGFSQSEIAETKNLWEIVEDKQNPKITIMDRTYVLSLPM